MTLPEKIAHILRERSFEIHDDASKMLVVESTDFDQIAMDIVELLSKDYAIEVDESS